jgi:NADH-quinone oxidoreductase subunit E
MKERIERMLSGMPVDELTRAQRRALVLPILQKVQREFGYVPEEVVPRIASFTGVTESHIYGVASFYSAFRFTPVGKNSLIVCCGTACHVRGSAMLLNDLRARLGINAGETTPDLGFSLDSIACFGSCSLAPVVVINGKVRGRMNRARLMKTVKQLAADNNRQGKAQTRGARS